MTVPANNGANITTILSVAWIVGIFTFAVFALVSYRKIHNKVRPSLNVRDNIWICDDIQTPFILGCFKPKIYIPSGTDEVQLPISSPMRTLI
ncbi:MAG: M56 family metallopeptidase [Pilosibacter sp.]